MNELYFKTGLNKVYFSIVIKNNKNDMIPFLKQVKNKLKKFHGHDFFDYLVPIIKLL